MSSPTSDAWKRTDDDDPVDLTPEDILRTYHDDSFLETYGGESIFVQLFTPKTRALILDVLVSERGDPFTARRIVDHHDALSTTSFNRHKQALLDLGVMVKADKQGNAQRYALNTKHPIAQLLAMIDNIGMWGETPQLLGEQFLTESDEPTAIHNLNDDGEK